MILDQSYCSSDDCTFDEAKDAPQGTSSLEQRNREHQWLRKQGIIVKD